MASCSSVWMMLALFLVTSNCEAEEYLVRDKKSSWQLPLPQAKLLIHRALTHRLEIGDSLTLKYDQGSDRSVVEVKEEHYRNCDKSNPIQGYNNGEARELNGLGPFYFISGTQDHCEQGLKPHVRVTPNQCFTCHRGPEKSPPRTCSACHSLPDSHPDSKEKKSEPGSKEKKSHQDPSTCDTCS